MEAMGLNRSCPRSTRPVGIPDACSALAETSAARALALTSRQNPVTMPDVSRFGSNSPLARQRQKSDYPPWERVERRITRRSLGQC